MAGTMSKVTSKRQVTIPKAVATRYGIEPGDEIEFEPAGDVIRVIPTAQGRPRPDLDQTERLRLFDRATERQKERQRDVEIGKTPRDRGWTREELYTRGSD